MIQRFSLSLKASLFLCALCLSTFSTVKAQVIIKETIDLSEGQAKAAMANTVTIPTDGPVRIRFHEAIRDNSGFPLSNLDGRSLKVVSPSETITEPVSQHYRFQGSTAFTFCSPTVYRSQFAEGDVANGKLGPLELGSFNAGDELAFSFIVDGVEVAMEVTPASPGSEGQWRFQGFGFVQQNMPGCSFTGFGDNITVYIEQVLEEGDYFEVTADPSTIAVGDSALVSVQAADRAEPGFDSNFTVDVTVDDPTLGHLVWASEVAGEWTEVDAGSSLTEVPYTVVDPDLGSNSAGRLLFVALEPPPTLAFGKMQAFAEEDSVVTVNINVLQTDNTTNQGAGALDVILDLLDVFAAPNPVAIADTSWLRSTVWNREQPDFDGNVFLTFGLERSDYGDLAWLERDVDNNWQIKQRGSTLELGDIITLIPYTVTDPEYGQSVGAPEERIVFLADPDDPSSAIGDSVLVTVTMAFSGGVDQLYIKLVESPLQITIPNPQTIWPTIPNRGVASTFDFSAVDNLVENIQVTVREDGQDIEGQDVEITADWIPQSGGHEHQGTVCSSQGAALPLPELASLGTFEVLTAVPPFVTEGDGTVFARTNADGQILLEYVTPEYGGKIVLRAETTLGGTTYTARDTLTIRVPDLVALDDGTTYTKVGGTVAHLGPPGNPNQDDNHYALQEVLTNLTDIADGWETEAPSQSPLVINDLSLPNGGLFDICGRWRTGHSFHRTGRDADIRTTRDLSLRTAVLLTQRTDGNGAPIRDHRDRILYYNYDFERLVVENGGNPGPEIHSLGSPNNEHYHLYFYPEN